MNGSNFYLSCLVLELIMSSKIDPFWSEQPSVLWAPNRLIEFVPTGDMTWKERLNALTRFGIYASLVLMMYLGKSWPAYIALTTLAFTLMVWKFSPKPKEPSNTVPTDHPTTKSSNPFIPADQPQCIPPTRDNPFMNVLQNEYVDNPTRPPACDYDDVKQDVENNWGFGLYKDFGEAIWDRVNSQRQWYTMPWTTIPNDQGNFANWLYKTGPICKTSQESCLRYEDLRANRPIIGDSENLN